MIKHNSSRHICKKKKDKHVRLCSRSSVSFTGIQSVCEGLNTPHVSDYEICNFSRAVDNVNPDLIIAVDRYYEP